MYVELFSSKELLTVGTYDNRKGKLCESIGRKAHGSTAQA
jgi:hypothetical protein